MFCKEAVMWRSLNHPNILPLLGATISPPQLVSALMPAGDLSKYLPNNPEANRIRLVGVYISGCTATELPDSDSCDQLSEIAEGLCYLHSRNIIHGDLKGVRRCPEFRLTVVFTSTS